MLFWRVAAVNGLVFAVGTALLVFSPITVSSEPVQREAIVLALGAVALLVVNGFLIRIALAPLDELRASMAHVDLLKPSRVPMPASRDFQPLVEAFNTMLGRLEKERGQSAARALLAQENERRRIAQELHDDVGQSLTVVLLALKRHADASVAPLPSELALAQAAARDSLEKVRSVAGRLRPGVLDDLGLDRALTAQATEFEAATGVGVRRGIERIDGVGPDVELVLYRIAQEALTNVARHARAASVALSLRRVGDAVVLTIEDDGIGLGRAEEGAGIRGMRERALLVGGRLEVQAGPDGGTQIRCTLPVHAAEAGD